MPPNNAKAMSVSPPQVKEEFIQLHGFLPRCSVTISQTIQTADYEPTNMQINYAEDVQPNDTKENTMARVKKFIKSQIAPEIKELQLAKKQNRK